MDSPDHTTVRRRTDGSIDIDSYVARGADARAQVVQALIRALASRLMRLWR